MQRRLATIGLILLFFLGIRIASVTAEASPALQGVATATLESTRPTQPPTVYPPSQADNGAQVYWGMCMDCHGDRGQGLIEAWRETFPPDYQNCWQSGCHGEDYPENSFLILGSGAPALAGAGKLTRFSNAFELNTFIQENMPLFPPGSLSSKDAWSLTAFILRMNDREPDGLTLDSTNSAAIPIHKDVTLPVSGVPGALALVGVLILVALVYPVVANRKPPASDKRPARPDFVGHLHPPTIPALQSRFRYTLGAGGLAVFFSLVLLITGLLEMYFYIPTPEQAAVSVGTITTLVPFGSLVRNLHFWSAQFLVVTMTVHMLRVVITGAYARPRRLNYLIGLGLLVLILLLDFTGYVLRWDEGIRWALVVGANLLKTIPVIGEGIYQFAVGGSEPGLATLTRFYTWHVFGLALGAAILVVWHAFRVRRDGGIAVPPPEQRKGQGRITRLDLLRREVLAMVVAGILLLLFAAIVPAPIDQPISESGALSGDSRAPWFFLWVQQLLKLGEPFLWGVLTPVLVVLVLGLLPYLLPNAKREELGCWFPKGNRAAQVITAIMILAILVLTLIGAVSR